MKEMNERQKRKNEPTNEGTKESKNGITKE